jgi:predicted RNA-binding protein
VASLSVLDIGSQKISPTESEPDAGRGSHDYLRTKPARDHVQEEVAALIEDSIIAAFHYFGGKKILESILYVLELEHGVNLKSVVGDLKPFKRAMMLMFGTRADLIEMRVTIELAKRLDVNYEGRTLEDLLFMARISIAEGMLLVTDHTSLE